MSAAMLSFVPGPVDPALLVAPSYSAPLLIDAAAITANGSNIFEGNWENTSYSANAGAAIQITTTQPVIIRNSRFKAQKYCIYSLTDGSDITVENCVGLVRSSTAGQCAQRFLNVGQPKNLVCEHNTMIGGGVLLDATATGGTLLVRIRYNRMLNVDGRKSDGAGGYVFERANWAGGGYWEAKQFLQIRPMVINDGEISWNEVENYPGVSRQEDSINMYGAAGLSGSPIRIHDNCIRGGWNSRPWDLASYSGGGIVCDRGTITGDWTDGATNATRWIDIDDNHVLGLVQHGISAPYGNNLNARRNRVICPNKLQGRTVLSANVGATVGGALRSVVNGYTYNVAWDNNVIGCVNAAGSQNNSWIPSVTATGVASAGGGTKTRLTFGSDHGLQSADNGNLVPVWSGTNWTPGNYAFTYVDATHIDLDVAWNASFGNPTLRSLTVDITNTTSVPFPTEADVVAEWNVWLAKKSAAGVTCGSSLVP